MKLSGCVSRRASRMTLCSFAVAGSLLGLAAPSGAHTQLSGSQSRVVGKPVSVVQSKFVGRPVSIVALMVLSGPAAPVYQPWRNAAAATAKQINARGGIKGHQLQIQFCDMLGTAIGSLTCGRQAVTHRASAMINYGSVSNYLSYAEKFKIPTFTSMVNDQELASPATFEITAGSPGVRAGMAAYGKVDGCKKMVFIVISSSVAAQNAQAAIFTNAANALGLANGTVTSVPQPDLSPVVANALRQGPDCLAANAIGSDMVALLRAIQTSGADVQVFAPDALFSPALAPSLGSYAQKVKLVANTPPGSATQIAGVRAWVNTINKYSAEPKAFDSNSAQIWAIVNAIAAAAKKANDPTSAKQTLAALNKFHNYHPGVALPISFDLPPLSVIGARQFQSFSFKAKYDASGTEVLVSQQSFNINTGKPGPTLR